MFAKFLLTLVSCPVAKSIFSENGNMNVGIMRKKTIIYQFLSSTYYGPESALNVGDNNIINKKCIDRLLSLSVGLLRFIHVGK